MEFVRAATRKKKRLIEDPFRSHHCQGFPLPFLVADNDRVTHIQCPPPGSSLFWGLTLIFGLALTAGCTPEATVRPPAERRNATVTLTQVNQLAAFEPYLPIYSDSLMALYERYDKKTFYGAFEGKVLATCHLIDSLNFVVQPKSRIDTLAIDHTVENFGVAARQGRTIFLSSSYFFLFDGLAVLRSALTHEFGHILYGDLSPGLKAEVDSLWRQLRAPALYYLFHDGEYSENARFGGHPDDSPGELFASAFNLFSNRTEEVNARLHYVETRHHALVGRIREIVSTIAIGSGNGTGVRK